MYILLTRRKVKRAGYWSRSLFLRFYGHKKILPGDFIEIGNYCPLPEPITLQDSQDTARLMIK